MCKSKLGGRKPLTAQAERQLENTAKGSTELGGMRLSCRQRLKWYIPDNPYQASPLATCSYCTSPNTHTDKFFQHSK